VKISFDPAKRARNLARHGLDLAEAGPVVDGLASLTQYDDRWDYGEDRWVSTGWLRGVLVVCVWTTRGESEARIISLRKATANEQKDYFTAIFG
jgi:uncharacterized protein